MKYFVDYNCKFIAMYKRIHNAMNFIKNKGLVNDYDNILRLLDENGNEYDPITGCKIEY